MKINKITIIILFLFIIAFTIRIIYVNSIPPGVFDDEANYGYDAWLISQSGKDQWGNFLPLQFKGFGDYRLPVTQYFIVPFVKFLGLNALAIRLPSVILGAITIIISYLLVKRLFKNDKNADLLGLITAFLLVFNPWHIALSRTVMEANIGLAFTLLAVYFYLDSQTNIKSFIVSVTFMVLSSYTYYGYRLFLALFLTALTIKNRNLLLNNFKKKLLILLVGLLFIIPILKTFNEGGLARLRQVNFWQDKSLLVETHEYRGACRQIVSDSLCRIFFNQFTTTGEKFLINYFNHFSPNFLFFPEFEKSWSLLPSSNSYFYLLDLILFIIGILFLFKNKNSFYIYLFLLLAPIADSLTGKGNFSRGFILVFPILIFMAMGWLMIYRFFAQKKTIFILLLAGYSYFYLSFFINYFIYFPKKQSVYTHYAYKPLFAYLEQVENQYDHIYISKINHDQRQYIFYLYYFQLPAQEYFNLVKDYVVEDNGWVWVTRLGKFHFINQTDRIEKYPANSLLVIDPDGTKHLPDFDRSIATIKYLNGDVAFNIYDLDYLKEIKNKKNFKAFNEN